ncbi:MAG: HRDC domain-containing protein [Niabella sp.]
MKVKHFPIRLNEGNSQQDEGTLNSFMQSVSVKKTSAQHITSEPAGFWSVLVFYEELTNIEAQLPPSTEKNPPFDPSTLNGEERNRYEALRAWRANTAVKDNVPNYIVASNSQLGAIAKLNLLSKEALYDLKGFGEKKANKYGDEIIAVLHSI